MVPVTEQILTKLAQYGLSSKLALQVFNQYQDQSLPTIEANPYQLVEDIQGIGFKTADQLAEQLGIAADAPERYRAGLIHTLFGIVESIVKDFGSDSLYLVLV